MLPKTYRFAFIPLHDGKLAPIKHALHHQPRQRLWILRVDAGSFDELAFQLFDAATLGFRGQVHGYGVDHRGRLKGGSFRGWKEKRW